MKTSHIKNSGIIFTSLLLILSFQNCNKVSMSPVDMASNNSMSELSGSEEEIDEVVEDETPVIADEESEENEESELPPADSGGTCGNNSSSGGQHITNIGENAFVLLCEKDLVHITNVSANAKVIVVGGSVGHITNVALGAEVITVDVDGIKVKPIKTTKNSGEVRAASEAEAEQFKVDCASIDSVQLAQNVANYQKTKLSAQEASMVPKQAGKYMFTNIESGVQLLDLHSNQFSATNIKSDVKVTVRTKAVRITNISQNAHVEMQ